ncbi:MAG TPA: NAD(P)H-binding protein, partial [Thermoplasmata archaeon]|nr:NAD(P)H-binding protein [Thermoplasmata archaeon]
VFGARGNIGRAIVEEGLVRGHTVDVVVRRGALPPWSKPVETMSGDVREADFVSNLAMFHDAVISAVGPGPGDDPQMLVEAAHALLEGMRTAGRSRLIVVGGAGSLVIAPGVTLLQSPDFPPEQRQLARAHYDALEAYQQAWDIPWTYVSPPPNIAPGPRTGHYRIGTDAVLKDKNGVSRISIEDFAVAIIDELERAKYLKKRITVAY